MPVAERPLSPPLTAPPTMKVSAGDAALAVGALQPRGRFWKLKLARSGAANAAAAGCSRQQPWAVSGARPAACSEPVLCRRSRRAMPSGCRVPALFSR